MVSGALGYSVLVRARMRRSVLVGNLYYPSGAVGCVSRNYADKKWRIVDQGSKYATLEEFPSYPSRDAAALAERELAIKQLT